MNWNLPLPQPFTLERRIAKAVLVPFCKLPSHIKPHSLEEEEEGLSVFPTKKIEQDFPRSISPTTIRTDTVYFFTYTNVLPFFSCCTGVCKLRTKQGLDKFFSSNISWIYGICIQFCLLLCLPLFFRGNCFKAAPFCQGAENLFI